MENCGCVIETGLRRYVDLQPTAPVTLGIARGSLPVPFRRICGAASAFITQRLLARWLGAANVVALPGFLLLAPVAGAGLPNAAMRFVGQAWRTTISTTRSG